jgi:hypothetical protein
MVGKHVTRLSQPRLTCFLNETAGIIRPAMSKGGREMELRFKCANKGSAGGHSMGSRWARVKI